MLSKYLPATRRFCSVVFSRNRKVLQPQVVSVRMSQMIPPSQYSMPWPQRLNVFYVMRVYWETIPLFVSIMAGLCAMVFSIASACRNKVDVVFWRHSSQNISRTMDLRNPTVHKLVTIDQIYEPWPEMQDVLDKMKEAEIKASLEDCDTP